MNYEESSRGILITISDAIAKEAKESFAHADWAKNIPAYLLLRGDDEITISYNELDEIAKDWVQEKTDAGGASCHGRDNCRIKSCLERSRKY